MMFKGYETHIGKGNCIVKLSCDVTIGGMGYYIIKASFINVLVLIRTFCIYAFSAVYLCERGLTMLSWNTYCRSSRRCLWFSWRSLLYWRDHHDSKTCENSF